MKKLFIPIINFGALNFVYVNIGEYYPGPILILCLSPGLKLFDSVPI